ncbi:MAG: PDZ domain-containing protein [Verrucomicrobia bacterium]|nr:PDZ domain-containing protein [Verrucomicrobiota bacterium]
MRWLYLTALLCLITALDAKPPELTAKDTYHKVKEILRSHACHHELTPELMKRGFDNFLEELDPNKIYFLQGEIAPWTSPSDELLTKALQEFRTEEFSVFYEIHAAMKKAVERRNRIEAKLAKAKVPTKVDAENFKDLPWVASEEELYERLLKIKGLQVETAAKFDKEVQSTFFQRIDKRRKIREEELVGGSKEEQNQHVLALILKAMSTALDSQTNYFTPAEATQFMIQVQQRLFGIGAQLRDDLNGFTITRILEGSPAAEGDKLHIEDRIIAVNGVPVVGMEITEAVQHIRGPQGTKAILTILRGEEKLDVEITRGEIVLKESRLESSIEPFGDLAIGVLKLFSFYQDQKYSSASDLAQAIHDLQKEHDLKGVILDLRGNAGGLLPQAVSVAGLFMSKGVVVSVKDNTGNVQHLRNIESKIVWDGPLIILTNRTSASAAEIVAQTLQEYGRAIIVGDETTYGKGTFQTFTLESTHTAKVNPKGEYKVTRGRYYTVSGKSPQLVGVKADIVVPSVFSAMEVGEKFSKYPLETDQIAPSFDDDLLDIPALHRYQVAKLYKFDLQPIMKTYEPFMSQLRQNTDLRLKENTNYQKFLVDIGNKNFNSLDETDVQMKEAVSLMKDLLFLNR